jgi:hypothetical protein
MQLSLLTTDATLNRFGRFARLVGGNTSDGGDFLRSDAHGLDLSARNRAERPMRLTIRFGGGSSPSRSPHFGASLVFPLACSFGAWDYQPAASLNKVAENLKGYSDGGIITATKPWPRPLPGIVLIMLGTAHWRLAGVFVAERAAALIGGAAASLWLRITVKACTFM